MIPARASARLTIWLMSLLLFKRSKDAGKQQQDGTIAQTGRRAPRAAFRQKMPDMLRRQISRDRSHRPSRDHRDGRDKISLDITPIVGELEKRAKGGRHAFRIGEGAILWRVSSEEVDDLLGAQGKKRYAAGTRQKSSDQSDVMFDGRRRETTIVLQISHVIPQDPIDRNLFLVQPSPECTDQEGLLLKRDLRITLISEVFEIGLKTRHQWPLGAKPLIALSTSFLHRFNGNNCRPRSVQTMPTNIPHNALRTNEMDHQVRIVLHAAYDMILEP